MKEKTLAEKKIYLKSADGELIACLDYFETKQFIKEILEDMNRYNDLGEMISVGEVIERIKQKAGFEE